MAAEALAEELQEHLHDLRANVADLRANVDDLRAHRDELTLEAELESGPDATMIPLPGMDETSSAVTPAPKAIEWVPKRRKRRRLARRARPGAQAAG